MDEVHFKTLNQIWVIPDQIERLTYLVSSLKLYSSKGHIFYWVKRS
jgi:hypothetical protein